MSKLLPKINFRNLKKYKIGKFRFSKNFKQVAGIILGVVGAIVVIQVVPLSIWFFLLGILLLALAWALFNML
ncbi:hypothetical protein [Abyssisolibacter fermentans]|uniref:hypothetical protein n=1 Tax=Abyssisolibacter fermentans TaxID=1766203 RepID=UPI00082FA838|nr:hypothetical protein [Abyssisolibacter fermentans]